MGYYTSFELKCDYGLIQELRKECESANYALDENGETNESCKWYEHDSDLMAFSKKHPNVLFTLSGEGEEAGDLWKKYYKNGLCQIAKATITYEEFNESKLRP